LAPNDGARLKEQDKKMQVEIERRLAVTISKIAQTGALPEIRLDPVISPSVGKAVVLLPRLHQVLA
jgi:hypothetical protein